MVERDPLQRGPGCAAQGRERPDELSAGSEPVDPARAAEDSELNQTVDDELEQLHEPYRTVMLLHLRHGMTPGEIARVVSRSPATARGHRGAGKVAVAAALLGVVTAAVVLFDMYRRAGVI